MTEQLDYFPGKIEVLRHIYPKYACSCCKDGVTTAPTSSGPIACGPVAPGLLAFVVVSKFVEHMSLYRQQDELARVDILISRSTLCGWLEKCAQLFKPLAELMHKEVLESEFIQGDETPVPVLDRSRDPTRKGYIWTTIGDRAHPYTTFHCTDSRDAEAAARGAPRQVEGLITAVWSSLMIGVVQPLLALLRLLARLALARLTLAPMSLARLTLAPMSLAWLTLRLLARLTFALLTRLSLLALTRLTLVLLTRLALALARLSLARLSLPLLALAFMTRLSLSRLPRFSLPLLTRLTLPLLALSLLSRLSLAQLVSSLLLPLLPLRLLALPLLSLAWLGLPLLALAWLSLTRLTLALLSRPSLPLLSLLTLTLLTWLSLSLLALTRLTLLTLALLPLCLLALLSLSLLALTRLTRRTLALLALLRLLALLGLTRLSLPWLSPLALTLLALTRLRLTLLGITAGRRLGTRGKVGRTAREIEDRRIRLDHIDEDSVDPVESLLQVFERLPRTDDRRVIRRPDLPKGAIESCAGLRNFLLQAGDDHRSGLRDVRRCWCPHRRPLSPVRRARV